MIYKTQTHWPITTIKAQLKEKAQGLGFGILNSYEFKKILCDKGLNIEKEVTVYELCNPKVAQEALNNFIDISVYLPCRLSIYEENGQTVLATISIEDILNAVDVDEEFEIQMKEIFNNMRALMNVW